MNGWVHKLFLGVGVLMGCAALARDTEGYLALLKTPNEGMPVITVPGGVFEATTRQQAELRLVGNDPNVAIPALSVEWIKKTSLDAVARCKVPASVLPGTYALEAMVDGKPDQNSRSVYVRSSFPETYGFAHLTDVHVGEMGAVGKTGSALLKEALSKIVEDAQKARNTRNNPSPPLPENTKPAMEIPEIVFVVITGDLTHDGTVEQFREFREALNTSSLPTYVCPGNHDRTHEAYVRFWGPLNYMFRFGSDGYLVFDTKDFMIADDAGPEAVTVALQRRSLRDCRWTIGVTHRYEDSMGMRLQMAIFVDDPVDWLLFGHEHKANGPDRRVIPWGIPMTITPALIDGIGRLVLVAPQGIRPIDPQPVVDGITLEKTPTKK